MRSAWVRLGLVGAAVIAASAGFAATTGRWAPAGERAAASERTERAGGRAGAAAADRSSGGAMWGAGYFPNTPLVTHRGERVRFFDDVIKGKVVAVNFIYTKCTDACPMETARMLEVQKLMRDRLGKDVFFYSISIDPAHDTPEVLRAYAETWKIGPGWTFLTGEEADITELRKKLGVFEEDLALKDHNLSLIIGNQQTGRWMKRSPYENPYVLASQLGGWLHNWRLPAAEERDYADAPEIRAISKGEDLFRTRCAACHTIGGGDRVGGDDESRIGPDLRDVAQRRSRDWLVRWVMEPDAMLAERDPIATELLARYRNLPMPNLRITRGEAEKLLAYIEEASRGLAAAAAAPAPAKLGELLGLYESTRDRLAADDLAGARTWAARLDTAARGASAGELAQAARQLAAATDLERARAAFGDASRIAIAWLARDPALRQGRLLFQCTMAPAYQKWIQTSDAIDNPYWGARMRRCGAKLTEWST